MDNEQTTAPGRTARQKILIVDDLEANLVTLEQVLKSIDAEVIRAQNGQEALTAVLEHDFALVILDVQMPGMDGYELAGYLGGDPKTMVIPIIFVTATHPDESHMFRGYEAGAIDFMIKPYSPRILMSKVGNLLEMDRNRKEIKHHRDHLERLVAERTAELSAATNELSRFSWLLEKEAGTTERTATSEYDDITELNHDGVILNAVGKETLSSMATDVMDLLDTSLAVHEKNGAYALAFFKSSWCRELNNAARARCGTEDNRAALTCGKWLCHDSSWSTSKAAMDADAPVDRQCSGGLRIHAVPVHSGKEIIGAVNFGYGTPPEDAGALARLAETYQIEPETTRGMAEAYKPRPPFIIEAAKRRLNSIARLIGEIVERKRIEEILHAHNQELERFNNMAVGRELRMIELKNEINALCRELGQKEPYSSLNATKKEPL